jgi:hypothetical protein
MALAKYNIIWLWKAKAICIIVFVFLLFGNTSCCFGQNDLISDSTLLAQKLQSKQLKYHYLVDFYSSFALTQLLNSNNKNDKGNFYFYYNVTLSGDLYFRKFSFNSLYKTDFGIIKYFDSIAIIQVDQYNLKNSLSYMLANSKIAANFMYMSRSQYYNQFNYSVDSTGKTIATPKSSFKSPGYRIISAGMRYSGKGISIEFGLVNGMSTIMKNQKYYDILQTDYLYGLEKGQKKKLDFGFSLTISAPTQKIYKNIYFENFSQARVIKDDLKLIYRYGFDINQAFHFIFLKYFRLSLRTKVMYDYRINLKPNIINNVTLGFYFHNSL